ncbi:MAG: 6-bladed beta-propeller [Bacteroides sp.]|nr:6-bladed beta-propeller [Bacteroidaceae bacterium]MBQ8873890.1 6-bladed beta-propeller [Bacteroides sp.]
MKKTMLMAMVLLACLGALAQNKTGKNVPEVDVTQAKRFAPLKVSEKATVEFIPLETNADFLLDRVAGALINVTENYIVTVNITEGKLFVFSRQGKALHTFCRKGQGPEEFVYPIAVRVDEKSKEIFVLDYKKVQVYSLTGKYKRSLNIPENVKIGSMFNYDDKHLICYDNHNLDRQGEKVTEQPFFLFSKKDGKITRIPLTIQNRIGQSMYIERDGKKMVVTMNNIAPMVKNGDEVVLSDMGSDVVYLYKKGKVTPLLKRNPGTMDFNPRSAMGVVMKLGDIVWLREVKKEVKGPRPDINMLTYDVSTGEVNNLVLWDDVNFTNPYSVQSRNERQELPYNCTAANFQPDYLKKLNEQGHLTGRLKELAEEMLEDDNPLLILYKLKE